MDDQTPARVPKNTILEIPAFGKSPAIRMDMEKIKDAESVLPDAKSVNPATYAHLEQTLNDAWRDLKRYLASIGYAIAMTEKALDDAKADVLLGSYAELMAGKPKSHDTADMRAAHLARDPACTAAIERIAQLKAIESDLDGKLKSMERTCTFMKKQIDILLRNGPSNSNYYVTSGKK